MNIKQLRKRKANKKCERKIIVIGGSMKFASEIGQLSLLFHLKGEEVYSAAHISYLFGKTNWYLATEDMKEKALKQYATTFQDIIRLYAKAYYVVAINGYIGPDTQEEINVAKENNVPVHIIESEEIVNYKHELFRHKPNLIGLGNKVFVNKENTFLNISKHDAKSPKLDIIIHYIKDHFLQESDVLAWYDNNKNDIKEAVEFIEETLISHDNGYNVRSINIHDDTSIEQSIINYYRIYGTDEYEHLCKTPTVHAVFFKSRIKLTYFDFHEKWKINDAPDHITNMFRDSFKNNRVYKEKVSAHAGSLLYPNILSICPGSIKDPEILSVFDIMFGIPNYSTKLPKNIKK